MSNKQDRHVGSVFLSQASAELALGQGAPLGASHRRARRSTRCSAASARCARPGGAGPIPEGAIIRRRCSWWAFSGPAPTCWRTAWTSCRSSKSTTKATPRPSTTISFARCRRSNSLVRQSSAQVRPVQAAVRHAPDPGAARSFRPEGAGDLGLPRSRRPRPVGDCEVPAIPTCACCAPMPRGEARNAWQMQGCPPRTPTSSAASTSPASPAESAAALVLVHAERAVFRARARTSGAMSFCLLRRAAGRARSAWRSAFAASWRSPFRKELVAQIDRRRRTQKATAPDRPADPRALHGAAGAAGRDRSPSCRGWRAMGAIARAIRPRRPVGGASVTSLEQRPRPTCRRTIRRLQTMLMKMKRAYSRHARKNRAAMFRRLFPDAMNQSILDLGGGDGTPYRLGRARPQECNGGRY